MHKFLCDLHIHSCLSPCASDDMTPANIAAMSMLNKLDIVALTDHNTSKNCPAFFSFAEKFGITPVAGMELTTAEDVHVVCLFPTLECAMDFDEFVSSKSVKIANKPEIFGHQYLMNQNDEVVSELPHLLINATEITIGEAYDEVSARNGVCYPAHIDREANGVIAILGAVPTDVPFSAFELNDENSFLNLKERFPELSDLSKIVSSDAHYLENISQNGFPVLLPDEKNVASSLIDFLSAKRGNI